MGNAAGRVFLFLQGPHGPFFRHLSAHLAAAGARVRRIAFNPGDEAEWAGAGPLERYLGPPGAYPDWLAHQLAIHRVTDIVLYGDSRPEHARAIEVARPLGVLCHCLEEGYLRPHRVTYERWGNNGNSPLHGISLARMAEALGPAAPPPEGPHDGWGAHRPHLWHAALYHARLLLPSRRYGRHRSRRDLTLWREFGQYLRRLAGLPLRRALQGLQARRLLASGRRYHLVLLQLSFDASMQVHSDYRNSAEFVGDCIDAFARGASAEDFLVFKSHPFEDGRERLGRVIAAAASLSGVEERVLFLDGGPSLTSLLDGAVSAVTINSTAAQQALWRGLPVAVRGRAVYAKPGLVSSQALDCFFADPRRPDQQAYWQFRQFLAGTSQLVGSFYSRPGIAALLGALPAAMLAPVDAYERVLAAAPGPEPVAPHPPPRSRNSRLPVPPLPPKRGRFRNRAGSPSDAARSLVPRNAILRTRSAAMVSPAGFPRIWPPSIWPPSIWPPSIWPPRSWLAAGLILSLGACALPRSGPDYAEITAPAPQDLQFDVVRVTPAVTAAIRIDERLGFARIFVEAAVENTATVAPGDVMAITVWENIDQGLLNPQGIGATPLPHVKVDERGFIFVPYVGLIRAEGRTLSQLRETIRARLAEMTLNPQVDVFPVGGQGRVVSIQGKVRAPGLYPIERPTERLLAMLARAGGVTEDPEVIRLKLRRGAVTGEIWVQDLYDDPANDVALHAGDALIAERDRRIFTALGAVSRPSTVPFPVRDLSAERAMGVVGGLIDASADPTGVFIFRNEPAAIAARILPGQAVAEGGDRRIVYLLDLTEPGGMFLAREFIMRDGDTLYVTSAPFTRWMKILQSVAPLITFSGSARALTTF